MVLGIVALTFVLAPRIFAGLPGVRLRAAADEIAATLRGLHEEAIRRQTVTELILDPSARAYRVSTAPGLHRLGEAVTGVGFTSVAILEAGTSPRVRFFADGSSSGGTIRLAHGPLAESVSVDWLTGRVSRHE